MIKACVIVGRIMCCSIGYWKALVDDIQEGLNALIRQAYQDWARLVFLLGLMDALLYCAQLLIRSILGALLRIVIVWMVLIGQVCAVLGTAGSALDEVKRDEEIWVMRVAYLLLLQKEGLQELGRHLAARVGGLLVPALVAIYRRREGIKAWLDKGMGAALARWIGVTASLAFKALEPRWNKLRTLKYTKAVIWNRKNVRSYRLKWYVRNDQTLVWIIRWEMVRAGIPKRRERGLCLVGGGLRSKLRCSNTFGKWQRTQQKSIRGLQKGDVWWKSLRWLTSWDFWRVMNRHQEVFSFHIPMLSKDALIRQIRREVDGASRSGAQLQDREQLHAINPGGHWMGACLNYGTHRIVLMDPYGRNKILKAVQNLAWNLRAEGWTVIHRSMGLQRPEDYRITPVGITYCNGCDNWQRAGWLQTCGMGVKCI